MDPAALNKITSVDLHKYAGKWFVIASIPTEFDKEWNYMAEHYTLGKNGRIEIETVYIEDGKTQQGAVKAVGYPDKDSGNIRWKVQYVWPFKSDYLIEDVAPDYSYAIVGHPEKKSLYILSRHSRLPEDTYIQLLTHCGKKGYDLTRLRKIPQ